MTGPRPITVVSSDNHIEPYAWAGRPELAGDSYYSFQQTIDYCVNQSLPLILAGDVFNKAFPDPYSIHFTIWQLRRLNIVGSWFIQGQHELNRQLPWLTLAQRGPGAEDALRHAHKKVFRHRFGNPEDGRWRVNFYGLDYLPAAELQKALQEIPSDTDVLVAHQVWEERMGKKASPEAAFRDVPYVSCIITGDFHGHGTMNVTGASGQNILVVSPGSQCIQTIDESGEKFFYVMFEDMTFESVKLKTRRVTRARLQNPNTFEDELTGLVAEAHDDADLPKQIQKPIFDIKYHEGIPDARKRIETLFKDKIHLFAAPIEFRTEDNVEEIQPAKNLSLEGALEDYRHESERYSTALRLLRADDPKTEIVQVVKEIMDAPIPDGDPFAT